MHSRPSRRCKLALQIRKGDKLVMSPDPEYAVATVADVYEDQKKVHILVHFGESKAWASFDPIDWLEIEHVEVENV